MKILALAAAAALVAATTASAITFGEPDGNRHPNVGALVADWNEETRHTMPPVLRVFGAASSLAVVIDGKNRPFGVLVRDLFAFRRVSSEPCEGIARIRAA